MTSASNISINQSLALLDSSFSGLAKGVSEGLYAFWIGSGISRERLDDLKKVICRVLEHLSMHIQPEEEDCKFRNALISAVKLAQLSEDQKAKVNYTVPVIDWPILPALLDRLVIHYSELLDIRVRDEPADYLLWEAVDIAKSFSLDGVLPDCEHLCIGILAIEGVLPFVASANWDGLIEAAVTSLSQQTDTILRVCVKGEDFRKPSLRTALYKFHGCAIRAGSEPSVYRKLLIARQSQITKWRYNPEFLLMRDELKRLAATKPTLMIGLSAQDSNIQDVFADGTALMGWTWPTTPPAHVFAEDELAGSQLNLLKHVYSNQYEDNGPAIEAGAKFPAFAKPLLTALVLHVLCTKLRTFACTAVAPNLGPADRALVEQHIVALRDRVASYDQKDRLDFIRKLVVVIGRTLTLFQRGNAISHEAPAYNGLSAMPAHMIPTDPSLATNGIRELAVALALVSAAVTEAGYSLSIANGKQPDDGAVNIISGQRRTRVFFAANGAASAGLEINSLVSLDSDDAIIIHSTQPVERMSRSPGRSPGRNGRVGLRHVAISELLLSSSDFNTLTARFREEAAL